MELDDAPAGPIVVIGSSGMDIIGRPHRSLVPGSSSPGEVRRCPGGVARNVAENLARLGSQVILITAVGDDAVGAEILAQAAEVGIDTRLATIVPGGRTGFYLAMLNDLGLLHVALDDMGLTQALSSDIIRQAKPTLQEAHAIFMDGNVPGASAAEVIRIAKAAGVPVAADPTSVALASRWKPHLEDLWLITPNEAEAEALCPHPVPHADREQALDAARHLVSEGVEIALVTMAEFGVGYASPESSGHVPAVQTDVVDPTGAGDALSAAVIFSLLSGIPLDESVRLGASAASLTLRTPGSVVGDLSLERLYDGLR
ncbi:MAG TPA: carbohydrate kinase family protein [Anaerolineales bacterium]|nr:carbohydrate kinase family protein [Anaerolineales bacterium]